jgi:hypothetical protein
VATTYLTLTRGLTHLGTFLGRPPSWKLLAARKFDTEQKQHIDRLLKQDKNYQAFMAKYGPEARASNEKGTANAAASGAGQAD